MNHVIYGHGAVHHQNDSDYFDSVNEDEDEDVDVGVDADADEDVARIGNVLKRLVQKWLYENVVELAMMMTDQRQQCANYDYAAMHLAILYNIPIKKKKNIYYFKK